MTLPVLKFPSKKLRNKTVTITEVNKTIRDLSEEMLETMYEQNGIGLAAPQVGEALRLIVMDVPKPDPIDLEKMISDPVVMINPEVLTASGTIQYDEGRLSCPELIITMDRFRDVEVRYLDITGRPQILRLTDLKGVCVQHELDHLNGVLLVDRLSKIDKADYRQNRVRVAKTEKDLKNVL